VGVRLGGADRGGVDRLVGQELRAVVGVVAQPRDALADLGEAGLFRLAISSVISVATSSLRRWSTSAAARSQLARCSYVVRR